MTVADGSSCNILVTDVEQFDFAFFKMPETVGNDSNREKKAVELILIRNRLP